MERIPTSPIKVIIFDFDGTIANSFKVFVEALEVVTRRSEPLTQEQIEDLRTLPLRTVVRKLGVKTWQLPLLVFAGRREIRKRMNQVKAFDHMPEMIQALAGQGYLIYILSTNRRDNIEDFLSAYHITPSIQGIYANVGLQGKVRALNRLRKKEGFRAEECAYIGDEIRDVEAAKKAGIAFLGVTWGFSSPVALQQYKPDALIERPLDLGQAITRLRPVA